MHLCRTLQSCALATLPEVAILVVVVLVHSLTILGSICPLSVPHSPFSCRVTMYARTLHCALKLQALQVQQWLLTISAVTSKE